MRVWIPQPCRCLFGLRLYSEFCRNCSKLLGALNFEPSTFLESFDGTFRPILSW
jgi:hypothetical protein